MRIVVFEDDAVLREVLRIALLSGGYEDVLFAKDGIEGYDLVVAASIIGLCREMVGRMV